MLTVKNHNSAAVQPGKTDMQLGITLMEFFNQETDRTVDSSGIDDFIMIKVLKRDLNKRSLFAGQLIEKDICRPYRVITGFENAYMSLPFSILYVKSYSDPPLAASTCFSDGVSCFSSASLMILDSLAIALATSRSASCFDLLQFS